MNQHTLTKSQAQDLEHTLSRHIYGGMPVGTPGESLLIKLRKADPNPGMKYATLYTNSEEEEVLQALINSHWGQTTPPTLETLETQTSKPETAEE